MTYFSEDNFFHSGGQAGAVISTVACRMELAHSSPDKSLAHHRENEILAKCGQSEMSKCLYSSCQCGAAVKDCIVQHREQRGVVSTALKRNTT